MVFLKAGKIHFFILFAVSFILYFNSLDNDFVYDDKVLIHTNQHIDDFSCFIKNLFNQEYFNITRSKTYRPVPELSYFLFYQWFGNEPAGYHIFNILFHFLNAALVYLLVAKWTENLKIAVSTSLLFASHPALSEAVTLTTFNDELLFSLFYLVAFYMYVHKGNGAIILSYFAFILSLLSKEMAVSLPLMIILYDLTLNKHIHVGKFRKRINELINSNKWVYSGYFFITIIYVAFRFFYRPLSSPMFEEAEITTGLFMRLAYIPYQLFQFIKIALYPFNLNADIIHHYPDHYLTTENIISVIIFILLVYLAIKIFLKRSLLVFGIAWFTIGLLPVLNIITIEHPLAERYLYLPIVGFCLILSSAIYRYLPGKSWSHKYSFLNIRTAVILLLLIIYGVKTISRGQVWKNSEILWTETLKVSPGSYRAHNNLGMEYYKKGDFEKAIHHFKQSVNLNPDLSISHLNLANALFRNGQMNKAIVHYQKAIGLDNENIEAIYNLAIAYSKQGNPGKAIQYWQKVLGIDPDHQGALENIQKAKARLE